VYSTYSDGREEAMEPVAQLIEPNISKSTSATPGPLSGQVAGADTIEVKMTVANAQIRDALRKFDLRVDEEEKRYVYFFDTPERDLLEAGFIARARRIVGDRHNSTVKFRPVDPGAVSRRWRKFEGFKIEADASEKGVDKSVSLTRPVKRGLIRRAVEGEGKIRHLFRKEHGD
jgi:nitrogen fixation protein FixH